MNLENWLYLLFSLAVLGIVGGLVYREVRRNIQWKASIKEWDDIKAAFEKAVADNDPEGQKLALAQFMDKCERINQGDYLSSGSRFKTIDTRPPRSAVDVISKPPTLGRKEES